MSRIKILTIDTDVETIQTFFPENKHPHGYDIYSEEDHWECTFLGKTKTITIEIECKELLNKISSSFHIPPFIVKNINGQKVTLLLTTEFEFTQTIELVKKIELVFNNL
jgi:hypothetical protein